MSETTTEALVTIRAAVDAGRAAEERLLELVEKLRLVEVERDAIRRQLPQYDCCYTGGPVSDVGGKHCPPESPCLTCRCERAEKSEADLTAEVARLTWLQSGAPMPGETPRSE